MQHHVFLSYSRKDSDLMQRISTDLRAADLQVWTDESLVPGTDSWKNAIENAIQNTGTFVVILSPDSKESIWVEREMDYARACNIPIIPVLARGESEVSAIPFELINAQRVDIRRDYDTGIHSLIVAIQQRLNVATIAKPNPPASSHFTYSTAQSFRLDPFNPLHQFNLALALFIAPRALASYSDHNSEMTIRQTTAWIVSWLAWLPFIMTTTSFMLGILTIPGASDKSGRLIGASLLAFGVGLFITARNGWSRSYRMNIVLAVATGILMFVVFVPTYGESGINFVRGVGLTPIAFLLTTSISIGIGMGIALVLANAAAGSFVGIGVASALFMLFYGERYGTNGGIALVVALALALFTAYTLDANLSQRSRSLLSIVLFGLLTANYIVMIWVYYLGGWSVLAGL